MPTTLIFDFFFRFPLHAKRLLSLLIRDSDFLFKLLLASESEEGEPAAAENHRIRSGATSRYDSLPGLSIDRTVLIGSCIKSAPKAEIKMSSLF